MSRYTDMIQRLQEGHEVECEACDGEGLIESRFQSNLPRPGDIDPPDPVMIDCEECRGTGFRPMTEDEINDAAADAFSDMCEGEPPVSMAEQSRRAWEIKHGIRG